MTGCSKTCSLIHTPAGCVVHGPGQDARPDIPLDGLPRNCTLRLPCCRRRRHIVARLLSAVTKTASRCHRPWATSLAALQDQICSGLVHLTTKAWHRGDGSAGCNEQLFITALLTLFLCAVAQARLQRVGYFTDWATHPSLTRCAPFILLVKVNDIQHSSL
jgi:hypothetical protein